MQKGRKLLLVLLVCLTYFTCLYSQTVYKSDDEFVRDVCFSEGGTIMAYTDFDKVRLCNPLTNSPLIILSGGHSDRILKIDISADSAMLVSAGRDSLLVVWDIASGKIIKKLDYHTGKVTAVTFASGGKLIVSGSTDKKVICYDLESDSIRFKNYYHENDVLCLDASPSGSYIASGGADKSMFITEVATGLTVFSSTNQKGWIRDLKFSSDGGKLLTCGDDGRLKIFNTLNTSEISMAPVGPREMGWMTSCDMHNDGKTIVTGTSEGNVAVKTMFDNYKYKFKVPVHKVRFVPGTGSTIYVVAATYGKGLILIPLSIMK